MTPLPSRISHYEIVRVLGRGGMGTVYLAMDPGLRRHVALKVLRADSDDQRERFRREARIVARLQHPNIVAIYAVGEHESQLYIAMEYIEGEPLSDAIRRREPWSLQRKLQMAADLCGGLAFAHRAGVIHRDVKPSNLMVSSGSDTLRLLDFGIARGADAAATAGLTMHGNIVGTLNYMSPEQITGQALDHRSDIFAVGLVLYELLSYRQAFPGDNLATLTYRIVHGFAESLRELQPDLDPELCGIVERAMSRTPDDRYPHLEAMRTDVLRVAARLSPEAAAILTVEGASGNTPASGQPLIWSRALETTVAATGPVPERSTARVGNPVIPADGTTPARRWVVLAGGTSIIASLTLAVWLVVERGGPSPGPVAGPDRVGVANPTTVLPPRKDDATETVTPPGPVESAKGPSTEKAATPPSSVSGRVVPERPAAPRSGSTPGTSPGQSVPAQQQVDLPAREPVKESAAPQGPGGTTAKSRDPGEATPTPVVPPVAEAPVPPTAPRDEELVQATIERWARAYTARDARGVDDVQPGTEAVMEKAFRDLRRVSITLSGCRIAVQGASATAACTEQHLAETKFGGAPTTGTRGREFTLAKSSGTWHITATHIVR